MAESTKTKKAYLHYYRKTKSAGRKPQTWASWLRAGKTSPAYGSISPTAKQRRTLSPSDAKAIGKFFRRK